MGRLGEAGRRKVGKMGRIVTGKWMCLLPWMRARCGPLFRPFTTGYEGEGRMTRACLGGRRFEFTYRLLPSRGRW